MGKEADESKARAEQLHRLMDRLAAGRAPGPGEQAEADSLREAVHRRMRELDEARGEETGGGPEDDRRTRDGD
ncbi:hypothetical protein FHS39_002618 [Streptomyces olivoverticillatus]|uniref:Uncharacterized protein n=1 Tax=Streptomyces olivoverticillatus TaxID=66427 RepID=A0A7W7LPG6_9ACTN|nr:hypothetical protein [Streptomyces olivoverticillatus]MBB4893587.1 hypothetical protein [Streptomyces olivoverticillatus]